MKKGIKNAFCNSLFVSQTIYIFMNNVQLTIFLDKDFFVQQQTDNKVTHKAFSKSNKNLKELIFKQVAGGNFHSSLIILMIFN